MILISVLIGLLAAGPCFSKTAPELTDKVTPDFKYLIFEDQVARVNETNKDFQVIFKHHQAVYHITKKYPGSAAKAALAQDSATSEKTVQATVVINQMEIEKLE